MVSIQDIKAGPGRFPADPLPLLASKLRGCRRTAVGVNVVGCIAPGLLAIEVHHAELNLDDHRGVHLDATRPRTS